MTTKNLNTLLIVDGDNSDRAILKKCLECESSFIIFEASYARRLIEIISQHHVDIIVLNYGLPDGKAIDYLKDIRRYTDVPLIITGSDNAPCEKTTSLNMGADDFICKPYDHEEMRARIHASLRRHVSQNQNNAPTISPECFAQKIKFRQWILDRRRHQVFDINDQSASLTHTEFLLLNLFITHNQTVLPREKICRSIGGLCNQKTSPKSLNIKIMRLRRKLHDTCPNMQMIRTVREVGYMFDSPLIILE